MSITLKLLSVDAPAEAAIIDAVVQIVASGNYAANGDTLNWSTLAGQQSQEGYIVDADLINRLPIEAYADSQTGGWGASQGGYYEIQNYTKAATPVPIAPTACKFRCFNAGGTELSAGAYDATIIQDYIVLHARFLRER